MVMSQEAGSWKAQVRVYVHRLAPAPRPCDTAQRSASEVKKPQPPSLPSQCCPEGHVGPCRDHLDHCLLSQPRIPEEKTSLQSDLLSKAAPPTLGGAADVLGSSPALQQTA